MHTRIPYYLVYYLVFTLKTKGSESIRVMLAYQCVIKFNLKKDRNIQETFFFNILSRFNLAPFLLDFLKLLT